MSYLVPRKRLFVGLLSCSLALVALLVVGIWYVSVHRMYVYQRTIFGLGGMIVLVVLVVAAVGILGLVLMLWKGRVFPLVNHLANVAANMMFPVAVQAGKLLGIDEDRIKSSFIEVNNQMVALRRIRVNPEELLVLAPHCLQFNGCPYKVTIDISNCRSCGNCQVAEFVKFRDEHGIKVAVVTGGTLARKHIREHRPRAVVAIACERDLTSGILDSYPLPVYGVLNYRPNGPCQDTRVDLGAVRTAIMRFVEPVETP